MEVTAAEWIHEWMNKHPLLYSLHPIIPLHGEDAHTKMYPIAKDEARTRKTLRGERSTWKLPWTMLGMAEKSSSGQVSNPRSHCAPVSPQPPLLTSHLVGQHLPPLQRPKPFVQIIYKYTKYTSFNWLDLASQKQGSCGTPESGRE